MKETNEKSKPEEELNRRGSWGLYRSRSTRQSTSNRPSVRRRGMSVSSKRSARSIDSQDSHKSAGVRNLFRSRRMSQSSLRSQAIGSDSDGGSLISRSASRRTSHADDSNASDTDEDLGETDEDVWFRDDNHDGDINVDELDQLLNLSDDENAIDNSASAAATPSMAPNESSPNVVPIDPISQTPQMGSNTPNIPAAGSNTASAIPNMDGQTPNLGATHSGHDVDDRSLSPPHLSLSHQKDPQSPVSRPQDYGSLLLAQPSSKQFVKYAPSELAIDSCDFEFDSNSSSEHKDARGFEFEGDKIGVTTVGKKRMVGDIPLARPLGADNGADPNGGSGPSGSKYPGGSVNEQSQRYSFYAANMDHTIHAPDLASLVRENESFSSLFNPKNGAWFLDCFRPTQLEMKALSRAFGIHPLTAEDIQTEDSRQKFEKFKNYYLVVYHTFEEDERDDDFIQPVNFYILVFNDGVISFHFEPVSHCRNVRRRMRQLRDHLNFSSDWIAYALIDDITDSFAPQIAHVEKEADFVENCVYIDRTVDMHTLLRKLGEGRQLTMQLMRMLQGKADVVRGFAKRCSEVHTPAGTEMALYLGDIQDHVVTMYQNLSAYEKILSRSHFNYMGLLQMEFVDSNNRMTGVLGKVTVLGTVLLPMNLVTGLFGMNVQVPGQDVENLDWFFGILAIMLGTVFMLLITGICYVRWSLKKDQNIR